MARKEASIPESNGDRRWSMRRDLSLRLPVRGAADVASLSATDFSETGFLGHCEAELQEGTILEVELPRIGWVSARVAWTSGARAGFNFTNPLSKGALSAAMLRGTSPASRENFAHFLSEPPHPAESAVPGGQDGKYSRATRLRLMILAGGGAWGAVLLAYILLS